MKPIALTPGDPAGIGPDLAIALARRRLAHPLIVIADPELLQSRADQLGQTIDIVICNHRMDGKQAPGPHGTLWVEPVSLRAPARAGHTDPANAAYVLDTLDRAARGCMAGRFSALVTGPVHKAVINDAGYAFSGHTEYLAARAGVQEPVMLLSAPGLRVALVTTHLPLAQVADAVTPGRVEAVLRTVEGELRTRFGISAPRLDVCGLNPHAGEGGHLGREEQDVISPVITQLRREGIGVTGPVSADSAFTPARLESTDAVVAMYHDQGLPVLKHMGFGRAVNVTLGLPFIRTSVDHGTALELAGSGAADDGSLLAAIETAMAMARFTHSRGSAPARGVSG